jgi:hypothetical protein
MASLRFRALAGAALIAALSSSASAQSLNLQTAPMTPPRPRSGADIQGPPRPPPVTTIPQYKFSSTLKRRRYVEAPLTPEGFKPMPKAFGPVQSFR